MNKIIIKSALVALISLFSITASAGNRSYKGTTVTKATGKEVVQNDLVLNITETGDGISFFMGGYEIFGIKDISISGIAVLDENGQIVSWDKVVIKGAPGKIKDVKGALGKSGADVWITGKSGGVIGFDIHYTAKII